MGIVTDYLRKIIQEQVEKQGLVVWYDPEGDYSDAASKLGIPDTHFLAYEDSFFRLRHQIEPFFGGQTAPRLLVYVPLDPQTLHHALIEIEAAAAVLKPGQNPVTRNTRLSVIARAALKSSFNVDAIENIVKRIDVGKLSLVELDKLADQGAGIAREALTLIFAGKPDEETALLFVASDQYDHALVDKDAVGQIRDLLVEAYGLHADNTVTPADLRAAFVRYLLRTDLLLGWQGERPQELAVLSLPPETRLRAACRSLAYTWRQRTDLRTSYIEWAGVVERELRLDRLNLPVHAIREIETFLAVERALQKGIEADLLTQASDDAVALAEAHQQSSFWSGVEDVQPRWALIASAGRLLLEAERIEAALKHAPHDAAAFIHAYTNADYPYCRLDSAHRQMEIGYHKFQFDLTDDSQNLLDRLVIKAREQYMQVGSSMAARFVRAYQQSSFAPRQILKQTQIFERKVKPNLEAGKTAYIWVDALRYEMALDLIKGLQDDFQFTLEPALATPPTITSVGMAALLPGADQARVVVHKDAVTLQIGETRLKDRSDRVKYLRGLYPGLVDVKLPDLVPKPKKALETALRAADFVLVTSQEIDESGETDNESARLQMDNVLLQLQQGLRILARCGIQTIVVTADHGHLFIETTGGDMKIDAPGGVTASLHRRVWVGNGGAQNDGFLRTPLSAFGLETDYELAVPYTFGVFPVQGGASRYFHGGLSPQEVIIPVLTLTSTRKSSARTQSDMQWELKPGAQKIGRFFSVQVMGMPTGLFPLEPPLVRLELRLNNQVISTAVSAGYGYDSSTENIQLRLNETAPSGIEPNTVTLMVTTEPDRGATGDLVLLDAIAGTVLAKLEKLELAIHM